MRLQSDITELNWHGRWNRGSRGSSCSPNFWHGRAGHSSCSPKSLSLLHCDVRLSRIDLDILEFCRFVGRSRTKKLSARGLRPPDPHQGLCPWTPLGAPPPDPRYRLALHALAMAPATACSPNFQTLPTPMWTEVSNWRCITARPTTASIFICLTFRSIIATGHSSALMRRISETFATQTKIWAHAHKKRKCL